MLALRDYDASTTENGTLNNTQVNFLLNKLQCVEADSIEHAHALDSAAASSETSSCPGVSSHNLQKGVDGNDDMITW
jgi:hypothetical protein